MIAGEVLQQLSRINFERVENALKVLALSSYVLREVTTI